MQTGAHEHSQTNFKKRETQKGQQNSKTKGQKYALKSKFYGQKVKGVFLVHPHIIQKVSAPM